MASSHRRGAALHVSEGFSLQFIGQAGIQSNTKGEKKIGHVLPRRVLQLKSDNSIHHLTYDHNNRRNYQEISRFTRRRQGFDRENDLIQWRQTCVLLNCVSLLFEKDDPR